ncbi:MFS transporter [Streptacidiphilus rugosus]|uniref:MFS transporter n=1 Tax=Streptacidiphilus rugosus TaxID=405783 RepID=UPI0009FC24BB|nr:MFS transporter [Streptacidiphilus rugosus]
MAVRRDGARNSSRNSSRTGGQGRDRVDARGFRGRRILLAGMAVDSLGSGMYIPFNLVFFQHVTHLPLALIGAVLTGTGLLSLAFLPAIGSAVDRFGAKPVILGLYAARAVGFALYPLATGLPLFALLALVTGLGDRGYAAAQPAWIGELTSGSAMDRLLALSRSLRNAGMGGGTLLASALIGGLGDSGFLAAAWLNAASFLGAGLLMLRVQPPAHAAGQPRTAARADAARAETPHADTARADTPHADTAAGGTAAVGYRTVLRDRPYLALTAVNFLVSFGFTSLSTLLPIFALGVLHLPAALTGTAFALNTAVVALAAVPATRLIRRIGTRTRTGAIGAALFAAAFLGQALLGTLRPQNTTVALAALLGGVLLATAGELLYSAGSSAMASSAAPAPARGRYLATYMLSWSLAQSLSAGLYTSTLAVDGRLPWLIVAAAAATGAALLLRLTRRLPAEAVYPTSLLVGENVSKDTATAPVAAAPANPAPAVAAPGKSSAPAVAAPNAR